MKVKKHKSLHRFFSNLYVVNSLFCVLSLPLSPPPSLSLLFTFHFEKKEWAWLFEIGISFILQEAATSLEVHRNYFYHSFSFFVKKKSGKESATSQIESNRFGRQFSLLSESLSTRIIVQHTMQLFSLESCAVRYRLQMNENSPGAEFFLCCNLHVQWQKTRRYYEKMQPFALESHGMISIEIESKSTYICSLPTNVIIT